MNLILYNVTDGLNVINKNIGDGVTIPINLKNDVNVVNPELKMRVVDGVNYDEFNYAFIDVLGRYYFIDRIGKINRYDSIFYLSCDVLETYKDDILNSDARLKRGIKTGDYDNVFIDSSVIKNVTTIESDGGFVEGETSVILTTIGA